MPSFCVVSNCELKYSHSENVSFHKFPINNPEILKEWIKFTDRGSNWTPSRWSSICSRHFISSDFRDYLSRKCLKKTAIPTVITKNNISYETYHINSNSNSHEEDLNGSFISPGGGGGCSINVINDRLVVSANCGDSRQMYGKANEIVLYCRLCGEHIDESVPNTLLHNINGSEISILLKKCLPTVSISQDPKQSNLLCLECDSHLRQYAGFVDKVVAHQKDLSPNINVNDSSKAYVSCSTTELGRTKATNNSTLFIKQEPVNVKQEVSEIINKKLPEVSTTLKVQQCKAPISQLPPVESLNYLGQSDFDDQQIQWTGEQTNAFCGLCDKFLANTHELKTHTCDTSPGIRRQMGTPQNTNCEIMEIVTLNNSVSFIDLAEDDYLPVERILKVENTSDLERRERVKIEHAYARKVPTEIQPAMNLKQEIEMNYDSSVEESPMKSVPSKSSVQMFPMISPLSTPTKTSSSLVKEAIFVISKNTEMNATQDCFTCTKCNKNFDTLATMQEHSIKMHSLKNKICLICSSEFKSVHDYLVHKNKMHAHGHQCYHCKRKFSTRHALNYHERYSCAIDSKDFYYSCKHCGESTRNRLKMKDHIKCCLDSKMDQHVNKRVVKIQNSSEIRPAADTIVSKDEINTNCKKFFCEVCGRQFSQRYNLKRHKESHCSMVLNKPHDLTQHLQEGTCTSNNIIKSTALKSAPVSTNDNQPILPKISNVSEPPTILASDEFQSTVNINNTKNKVCANNGKYVCETCEKPFRTHASLKQHRFTHFSEKKFICKLCPKTFKRVSGLNQHIRGFHYKIKPYICPVCNYSYALKGDMLRCRHSKMKKL